MKRIAVFTGTRAEYGLFYWLLKDIHSDPDCELLLYVSGSHLSPQFGNTYVQIEKDGFDIKQKIEILLSSDTPAGTAKSVALCTLGLADALTRDRPDVLVLLGDRFETFAAAQTAMIMRIPVAHLHGGEITEGAYDDAFRHAISKLSYLHFTAAEEYAQRVVQLGEAPERVFNFGAIGLDHLLRSKLMTRTELAESLGFPLDDPFFLVTYHPETLSTSSPLESFKQMLMALDQFPSHKVILTYPNADDGGQEILAELQRYQQQHQNRVLAVASLGQIRYLSAIKFAAAVVGNSSSGIIEVPAFNVPTVNIGNRQKGRLASASVIHCDADSQSIKCAIKHALSEEFQNTIKTASNPYGQGGVSNRILGVLKTVNFDDTKSFYDLNSVVSP